MKRQASRDGEIYCIATESKINMQASTQVLLSLESRDFHRGIRKHLMKGVYGKQGRRKKALFHFGAVCGRVGQDTGSWGTKNELFVKPTLGRAENMGSCSEKLV